MESGSTVNLLNDKSNFFKLVSLHIESGNFDLTYTNYEK
jgi:hypothetical protein